MSEKRVYLILGPAGSGRRAVLADLLEGGVDREARPQVFLAEAEAAHPEDEKLAGAHPAVAVSRWRIGDGRIEAELNPATDTVFVVSDGRADPVDIVEALPEWMARQGAELSRVMTVFPCALAHAVPRLKPWFDACIHFSDVILLTRREGVPNKWISDFRARLRRESLPCLVETVKKGRVGNPALILEAQPRRLSLYFDEPEDIVDEEDDEFEMDESGQVLAPVDPYIERLVSGRRARELPDIRPCLDDPA